MYAAGRSSVQSPGGHFPAAAALLSAPSLGAERHLTLQWLSYRDAGPSHWFRAQECLLKRPLPGSNRAGPGNMQCLATLQPQQEDFCSFSLAEHRACDS